MIKYTNLKGSGETMNFAYRAGEINEYIINIRRHIHAHPELSFNERKTTAYIADKLEKWA